MFDPRLDVSRDGMIAIVTFNRPERRNAFDLSMWRGLHTIMQQLSADNDLDRLKAAQLVDDLKLVRAAF